MLTPLSSLSSPNTIDIGSTPISVTPAQSPTGVSAPNPNTDPSNKTHVRRQTSATSTTDSSSSSSAHLAATKPATKSGTQPHPQQPHPQPPSSARVSPAPVAHPQKGVGVADAEKTPSSTTASSGSGGSGSGGTSVGSGVQVGGTAGGDHMTQSKTPAGLVTATALMQRQLHPHTSSQGGFGSVSLLMYIAL